MQCAKIDGRRADDIARYYNYKGRDFVLNNAMRDSAKLSVGALRRSMQVHRGGRKTLTGGGDLQIVRDRRQRLMIHIEEAVIVEGKYDKIKLSNFLDAMIVETGGFAIYKDKKRLQFIRRLAMERGIIILTDSDHSGFQIRNYIAKGLPPQQVKHL